MESERAGRGGRREGLGEWGGRMVVGGERGGSEGQDGREGK